MLIESRPKSTSSVIGSESESRVISSMGSWIRLLVVPVRARMRIESMTSSSDTGSESNRAILAIARNAAGQLAQNPL